MELWRLWLLGTAVSTECAARMVLSNITLSGLLLWTVRSVDISEQFIIWFLYHGLWIIFIIRHWWALWQSTLLCYKYKPQSMVESHSNELYWQFRSNWWNAIPDTVKKKVKESRNRPSVAQRVSGGLGSQSFMTFGTWRWWGCQPHAPAAFTPRKCS
jgi:hypothetical protein